MVGIVVIKAEEVKFCPLCGVRTGVRYSLVHKQPPVTLVRCVNKKCNGLLTLCQSPLSGDWETTRAICLIKDKEWVLKKMLEIMNSEVDDEEEVVPII